MLFINSIISKFYSDLLLINNPSRMKGLLLLLIILSTMQLSAQIRSDYTIKTGARPAFIHYSDNAGYDVLCAGWDANYNGIFEPDSGDVKASWWYFENSSIEAVIKAEFEWPSLFIPIRPAFTEQYLFLPQENSVKKYNLKTGEFLEELVSNIPVYALSISESLLFISARYDEDQDWSPERNEVLIYDYVDKLFIDTLVVSSYVQQTLPYIYNSENYLAVLCEGTFGANDSKLFFYKLDEGAYQLLKDIELGGGGNHIEYGSSNLYGEILIITMNGSLKVHIFSLSDQEIIKSIDIDTPSWDGPRECKYVDSDGHDFVFVSCWDSKIRVYDLGTGNIFNIFKTDGKAEGILFDNGRLFVANPYLNSTYLPNDSVSVFIVTPVSVSENYYNELVLFPNPVSEILNIKSQFKIDEIKIFDQKSVMVYVKALISNDYSAILNFDGQPNGVYYILLNTEFGEIKKQFIKTGR